MPPLVIRDFNNQSVVSVQEIKHAIDRIPKFHLAGLRTILYKPAWQLRAMQVPVGPGCKGGFYPEFRGIIIHDLESRAMYKHILYHEIGHYVFHAVIGSFLKQEWITGVFAGSEPVTDYGRLNGTEDFAETYALYVTTPELLGKHEKKLRFMRDKVFNESSFRAGKG